VRRYSADTTTVRQKHHQEPTETAKTATGSALMAVVIAVIASVVTFCVVLAGVQAFVSLTAEPPRALVTSELTSQQIKGSSSAFGVLLGDEHDCSESPRDVVRQVQQRRLAENASDPLRLQLVFPTDNGE
jgi:hypothetical protein